MLRISNANRHPTNQHRTCENKRRLEALNGSPLTDEEGWKEDLKKKLSKMRGGVSHEREKNSFFRCSILEENWREKMVILEYLDLIY